jgi:mannose-1-phosphate guanylyltransferase
VNSGEHIWVVILAAGEGSRVRDLTRDLWGRPAPKQYASIDGKTTLLGTTLERAKRITHPERIVPVVAVQHRRWWSPLLAEIPRKNVVVQPENRGTAAGILLPLLWITERDPHARLVILPSDHAVASEEALHRAIMEALLGTASADVGLVLLGIRPERPEPGCGWILPHPGGRNGLLPIASFQEKPTAAAAASLRDRGALLNSFIVIAEGGFLLDLFETALPQLWQPLYPAFNERSESSAWERELAGLYDSVPVLDFSRDFLERTAERCWVFPVPACGWLDLGTPERLTRHLTGRGQPTREDQPPLAQGGQQPQPGEHRPPKRRKRPGGLETDFRPVTATGALEERI